MGRAIELEKPMEQDADSVRTPTAVHRRAPEYAAPQKCFLR